MKKVILRIALSLLMLSVAVIGQSQVKLPDFVTDSMVIQQNEVLTLRGTAKPDSRVSCVVSWNKKSLTTLSDAAGKFEFKVATPAAGGPFTIKIDDGVAPKVLRDIYAGEVWVCSGQSNMEMPIVGWGKIKDYQKEKAQACYPEIRFLQISRTTAVAPAENTAVTMGGWRSCSPESVENFSAVAYLYARELHRKLGVPVGVIDCSWGGTPCEAWTSYENLHGISGLENHLRSLRMSDFDKEKARKDYNESLKYYSSQADKIIENVKADVNFGKWNKMRLPECWEESALPNFNGVVLFRRVIDIPAECAGKELKLSLAKIDDNDETWFNGEKVGATNGYRHERCYTVPAALVKAGKNVILVKVSDTGGNGGICGDANKLSAEVGGTKIDLSGDWDFMTLVYYDMLPPNPLNSSSPTVLYNAMLYPLHTLPIKGAIWYQGCANVGRDRQYSAMFKSMIQGWRNIWNRDFPFYFVQLAGYLEPKLLQPDSKWAALRQAQADALALRGTGMATAIDIGEVNDIHPKNKQEVARRLSLLALKHTYGFSDIVAEAPVVIDATFTEGKGVLSFSSAVNVKSGAKPAGFIIENADGSFSRADAVMMGNDKIEVRSDKPGKPLSVRYDWADFPDGNLYGANGLPVTPFRTDMLH